MLLHHNTNQVCFRIKNDSNETSSMFSMWLLGRKLRSVSFWQGKLIRNFLLSTPSSACIHPQNRTSSWHSKQKLQLFIQAWLRVWKFRNFVRFPLHWRSQSRTLSFFVPNYPAVYAPKRVSLQVISDGRQNRYWERNSMPLRVNMGDLPLSEFRDKNHFKISPSRRSFVSAGQNKTFPKRNDSEKLSTKKLNLISQNGKGGN